MSLNCNEINLILSELNIEGSFIQEIIQPGYDTVSFKIVGKTARKYCNLHITAIMQNKQNEFKISKK